MAELTEDEINAQLREQYQKFAATASPQERAAIDRVLQTAHQQANGTLGGDGEPVQYPSFATAWSAIDPEAETPGGPEMSTLGPLDFIVDGAGLIWGPSKYLQLD